MAKLFGGAIYFETSLIYNKIEIKNLILNNVISLMGSFIYVNFNNEDISYLHINDISWTIDKSFSK